MRTRRCSLHCCREILKNCCRLSIRRRSAPAASNSAACSANRAACFSAFRTKSSLIEILGQPAFRQGRGYRGDRRRTYPWPWRPGRRRHGHPDRQVGALHRLRRESIRRPRCRFCSMLAPTMPNAWPIRFMSAGVTSVFAAREYDDFVETFVSAVTEALAACSAAVGGLRQEQRDPHARSLSRPAMHFQ